QEKIDLQKFATDMPKEEKEAQFDWKLDLTGTQASEKVSIMQGSRETSSGSNQQEKGHKPEEFLVLGNTMYSSGKYEEAIGYFNRSLEIDPRNSTAWNNKGLALSKLGRIDETISCYDKALEINSGDHVVLNNKGSALYKKGQINEAMQCYESALELRPDNSTSKRGKELCSDTLNRSRK
ncbi:MAG TPA: tetratricopeptide repeat protein, partial [Candidatus Methanoperedens sp.]|nr:tetratricopeptide repeat protein [Candidatus Methanoperedens sp.]